MNNAIENAGLISKGVLMSILGSFPVGATAKEIYQEMQNRQVKRKIERLEEFYHSLDERISAVESNVNEEFVSKEDFQDVFEEATRYVVLERQQIKRNLFKNILANSIIAKKCDYDKTEKYFRILDNLTEQELKVLAVLDNPSKFNEDNGMLIEDPINNAWQSSMERVTAGGVLTRLLKIKDYEATEAVTILVSNGLVVSNFMDRSLATNSNTVHVLDNLLTIRGRDFVKFLKV